MKPKQIYAALDIGSYEIKLVVGEFHNTRFNVIRVERIPCKGVQNFQIVNMDSVVKAINKAVMNVNELLQVRLENVLLSIPAYQFKRRSARINVPILHDDQRIALVDIQNAIKLAQRSEVPSHMEIVNVVPVKYLVNGISTRRMPIGEECDTLYVDMDLLCIRRQVLFDYVRCVEACNLGLLDIFAQPYADAKEAMIFEQSVDSFILYVNIGHQISTMTLYTQGRIAESMMLEFGSQDFDKAICEQFMVSEEAASRLKQYNCHLLEEQIEDTPIYIWNVANENYSLTERQLFDTIRPVVDRWLGIIKNTTDELLNTENVKVIFSGGGGETFELAEYAQQTWGVNVTTYVPDSVGARSASLISALGLFYAFKDAIAYTQNETISVDPAAFNLSVTPSEGATEEGFTGRLKSLLFNDTKERISK